MKKLSRVAACAVVAAGWILTCAAISNADGTNAEKKVQGAQVSPSGSATEGTPGASISGSPEECKDRPGACISVKRTFITHEVDMQGSQGAGAGGAPDETVKPGVDGTTDKTGSDNNRGDGAARPSE